MRKRNAFALAAATVLGAGRTARADEVVLLQDLGRGLLSRSDRPKPAPGTIVGIPVAGLEDDESLLAIDTRPGVTMLFGMSQKRLYALDLNTGVATPAGPRFRDGLLLHRFAELSFDIRPATDLALVVQPRKAPGVHGAFLGSATERVTLGTGAVSDVHPVTSSESPAFVYVEGDPHFGELPQITLTAYAGNVPGSLAWTNFGIDVGRRTLVRLGSPQGLLVPDDDGGAAATVAPLAGIPGDSTPLALEIGTDGAGLLLVRGLGGDALHDAVYRVDLSTGDASLVWDIGQTTGTDIAILPAYEPDPPFALDVRKAFVRLDRRRTHRSGDSVDLEGVMSAPANGVAGRRVTVDVDGIVREFTLDARGRARSGPDRLRLVGKRDGMVRFALVVRGTTFDSDAGVRMHTPQGDTRMLVDFFVDGTAHRSAVHLVFAVRRFGGVARLAK